MGTKPPGKPLPNSAPCDHAKHASFAAPASSTALRGTSHRDPRLTGRGLYDGSDHSFFISLTTAPIPTMTPAYEPAVVLLIQSLKQEPSEALENATELGVTSHNGRC